MLFWGQRMLKPHTNNQDGFTLIELITIMGIIVILAVIAIPSFFSIIEDAHNANMDAVYGALGSTIYLAAADSFTIAGNWRTPLASQVTTDILFDIDLGDWSDDGSGVFTYVPTGGTIQYIRINNDDYTLIKIY